MTTPRVTETASTNGPNAPALHPQRALVMASLLLCPESTPTDPRKA